MSESERQREGQTDQQTDRQTYRQADRQTDTHTHTHREKEREREREREREASTHERSSLAAWPRQHSIHELMLGQCYRGGARTDAIAPARDQMDTQTHALACLRKD